MASRFSQTSSSKISSKRKSTKHATKESRSFLGVLKRLSISGWTRLVPLLIVLFFGLTAAFFVYAPAQLLKPVYPLSYEEEIEASAKRYSVDATLVAAVIKTESNWNPTVESQRGAVGLMQLMPETARDMAALNFVDDTKYDPNNLDDPATNIEYGCAYLSYLIDYFNGSIEHAIAAYNAGLSYVEDWAQDSTVLHNAITFPETQSYLIKVQNAWDRYRVLYGFDLG